MIESFLFINEFLLINWENIFKSIETSSVFRQLFDYRIIEIVDSLLKFCYLIREMFTSFVKNLSILRLGVIYDELFKYLYHV